MKKLYLFLCLIFFYQFLNAQSIDTIVRRAANKFQATGSSVGFSIGIIDDKKSFLYHFGSARKGEAAPPNNATIYEIGSVTKTFTSFLLAQAVIEHRANLTDDVRAYLTEQYPNLQFEGKAIQLVQLSNLTSGLPNNLPEKLPALRSTNVDSQIFEVRSIHEAYSKRRFLSDLHTVKLNQSPGLSPAHSNTAAQLQGFTLENLYHSSYQALLEKYITVPFQMNNTYVTVPPAKKQLYAHGYNDKGTLMPDIPQDAAAAGVLKSSLPDMIAYLKVQMSERSELIKLSHRPTWGDPGDLAVGLNWMLKTNFDGKRKIWASGGTFGQSCYICFYPERRFGIVILSNESDGGAEDRLSELAQTVYNERYFTAEQRSAEGFGFSESVNRLLDSLHKYGFQNAIPSVAAIKKVSPEFKLYENEVNLFGYYFFFKGQKEKAVEIFKLNTSLYPSSANTYDSLAETYEELGDKDNAIKSYQKEIELNPENKDIADHLKKLKGL